MISLSSSIYSMLLCYWNAMTDFGRVQTTYAISGPIQVVQHLLSENNLRWQSFTWLNKCFLWHEHNRLSSPGAHNSKLLILILYYNTDISLFSVTDHDDVTGISKLCRIRSPWSWRGQAEISDSNVPPPGSQQRQKNIAEHVRKVASCSKAFTSKCKYNLSPYVSLGRLDQREQVVP